VEGLIASAIASSAQVADLRPHEHEDLCAYLIGVARELSIAYNPARGRVSFSSFLGTTARLRIIDWVRKERGRSKWSWSNGKSYERERPRLVSVDADDSLRDRLDETVAARTSDPSADSSRDLAGFLEDGDRERARDRDALGLSPYG
jgi:DNA-directed RNA polymerase specialized sigma24 family protein